MYIVNDTPAKVKWENERSSQEIFGHMDENYRTVFDTWTIKSCFPYPYMLY